MDTLPSPRYHSPLVKQFNSKHPAGSEAIDLSEQALIAEARRITGLERFGNDDFLPPLRTLLDAIENEANLNPFGRHIARTRTLQSLTNRLWANASFEAHPEIRQCKLAAPVIIIGLHRSGTTRLQRMMATDPRLQHLTTWEGINPAPRANLPDAGRSTRYEEVKEAIATRHIAYPGALAHPMGANWPEEEMLLLNHSFSGFSALGLYHVPSYYRWFLADDKQAGYRYMADLLRLISRSRNAPEENRWLLKNPQHMLDLPTLMQTFPDAKLVFMHRDPLKTVGSIMSLSWHFAVQHTDQPCRTATRDIWMDFYEQMARRCIEARENIPAAQQLDVHYSDMNHDWRATMRRIYQFADMEFDSATENAMAAWLAESEREGLHSNHRYALKDFGTTTEDVDARMQFYRERYDIPYENRKV